MAGTSWFIYWRIVLYSFHLISLIFIDSNNDSHTIRKHIYKTMQTPPSDPSQFDPLLYHFCSLPTIVCQQSPRRSVSLLLISHFHSSPPIIHSLSSLNPQSLLITLIPFTVPLPFIVLNSVVYIRSFWRILPPTIENDYINCYSFRRTQLETRKDAT